MLRLLYKQHRLITLLYIETLHVHYSRYFHPILVSLNLGNDEVSVQALYVLYALWMTADYKEPAECEELVVPEGLVEYCS
jgi:hypothetical protein